MMHDLSDGGSQQRKRGADAAVVQSLHYKAKEDDSEHMFKNLHKKHSGKFEAPKLRLWSRLIAAGSYDDYDEPPDIPAFSKNTRRQCQIALVVQQLLLWRHCKIRARQLQQVLHQDLYQLGFHLENV